MNKKGYIMADITMTHELVKLNLPHTGSVSHKTEIWDTHSCALKMKVYRRIYKLLLFHTSQKP
ncbi:hypothetical protein J6590_087764 [Homalodisca vitripennis]|nr:hypothetical protein J6590_087764 [Homalodisca vitripennis]